MKYLQNWQLGAVAVGLLIAYYTLSRTKETFVPDFLDKRNVKRTIDTERSSYAQQTNHFQMSHSPPDPIAGVQTPFRVNMYNAYME